MSSFKQLNKADVTTVPYAANKQWVIDDSTFNSKLNVFKGVYTTGTFSPNESMFNEQYRRLVFTTINHMFYQSYSGSLLNTGSLMFNTSTYESASQQRPTSLYTDYNISPYLVKRFPTGSDAKITVVAINPQTYGSKILPTTLKIESGSSPNAIKIVDDGYGNLYDVAGLGDDYVFPTWPSVGYFNDLTPGILGPIHVGNIFYAHGLIVITDQSSSYQNVFEDVEYLSTEEPQPIIIITENNTTNLIE